MFSKKSKRKYYARLSREGEFHYSTSSGDKEVTSDAILSSMESLYKKDGKVVVEFIDDNEIRVTSLETINDEKIEIKLEEIKNIIKKKL